MKIGDLARASGLSVRALRYYEQIGLLRPPRRSPRGHREYGERELLRLQHVLSLRALGLSLREVRDLLGGRHPAPVEALAKHATRVRAEIAQRQSLLGRLEAVITGLATGERPSVEQLLRTIEETTMIDRPTLARYFTPEQIAELARREPSLPDARAEAEAWRAVIAEARAAHARGTAADDPALRPLAERWTALLRDLGADDPAVRASFAALYRGESRLAVQYGLDGGVDRYVGAMLRAHSATRHR